MFEIPHLLESVIIRDNKRSVSCFLGKLMLCIESRAVLGTPASRRLTGVNIGNSQINREIAAAFASFEEKMKLIVKACRRDAGAPRTARLYGADWLPGEAIVRQFMVAAAGRAV
jgi:hypothetical protein